MSARPVVAGTAAAWLLACAPTHRADTSVTGAHGAALTAACGAAPGAAIPYPTTPSWTSMPMGLFSTGLALADINGDGFEDMVVSNGNDLGLQSVVVYLNDGAGRYPEIPSWFSDDLDFNTGLAVGDVSGDGWPDLAVAVGLGPDGAELGGRVKVYFNTGSGALERRPSYETGDRYSPFACALGDADGDGDLDLAVAVMQDGSRAEGTDGGGDYVGRQRIYYNEGGNLGRLPGWKSDDAMLAGGAMFADLNRDGLLDLAVAAGKARVYGARAEGGRIAIATSPSWIASDGSFAAFSLDVGPIGADPSPALVVSYNDVCYYRSPTRCGQSHVVAYRPGDRLQRREPIWSSQQGGLGAGVVLADVAGDERLDLFWGRWGVASTGGAPLEVYLGQGDAFEVTPVFRSCTRSVTESIAVADVGHTALREATETFAISRASAIVTLSRQVVAKIEEVRRNDVVLPRSAYATVPGRSWLSFAERLRRGDTVHVRYSYSAALDVAYSNASCGSGNYLYYHSALTRSNSPSTRRSLLGR